MPKGPIGFAPASGDFGKKHPSFGKKKGGRPFGKNKDRSAPAQKSLRAGSQGRFGGGGR